MPVVANYGLHTAAGGIGFLLQEEGTQHALPVEVPSPFTLLKPRFRCPHAIDLRNRARAPDHIASDPLFQLMAPTPSRGEVFLLHDPTGGHRALVTSLTRLSSPTGHWNMLPMWEMQPAKIAPVRSATNVSTLVLYAVQLRHMQNIIKLIEQPGGPQMRRVLLISIERLPRERDITVVETQLCQREVDGLPLEAIGAEMLHRCMQ